MWEFVRKHHSSGSLYCTGFAKFVPVVELTGYHDIIRQNRCRQHHEIKDCRAFYDAVAAFPRSAFFRKLATPTATEVARVAVFWRFRIVAGDSKNAPRTKGHYDGRKPLDNWQKVSPICHIQKDSVSLPLLLTKNRHCKPPARERIYLSAPRDIPIRIAVKLLNSFRHL
jgi:hypothetical protein